MRSTWWVWVPLLGGCLYITGDEHEERLASIQGSGDGGADGGGDGGGDGGAGDGGSDGGGSDGGGSDGGGSDGGGSDGGGSDGGAGDGGGDGGGEIDCDPDTDGIQPPSEWFFDADGDGYGDPATSTTACEAPDGWLDDDSDCDDTDAAVRPGATEVCDNGSDDDCDGSPGGCRPSGDLAAADADLVVYGESDGDQLGAAVAGVGDVDGDGIDDLLLGAPSSDRAGRLAGAAFLLGGGWSGTATLDDALAVLVGTAAREDAGTAVGAAGDLDGDGYGDVLVGAPAGSSPSAKAGSVAVLLGPLSGELDLSLADATWTGTDGDGEAGAALAGVGDVDGDGVPDLVIGGPGTDGLATASGVAWLVLGPATAGGTLSTGATALAGVGSGDGAGTSLAAAGDVDGDGLADFLVGAPQADDWATDAGASYLVLGPATVPSDLSEADGIWLGPEVGALAGTAVAGAGDVDGDGLDDVLVGAPGGTVGGDEVGVAWLLLGPATGSHGLDDGDVSITGESDGDAAGTAVAGPGDLDSDGHADAAVGATGVAVGATDGGAAYLLFGPLTGAISLSAADARILGESASASVGAALAGGGEALGVGRTTLLVGGPGAENPSGDGTGAVLLFDGGW